MTAVHQEAQWSTPLDRLSISFLQRNDFHKVSDLEERNVLSYSSGEYSFGSQKSKISITGLKWTIGRVRLPPDSREESAPYFFQPVDASTPLLVAAPLPSSNLLTLSSPLSLIHVHIAFRCVCVSDLPLLLSYKNTCHLQLTQIIQDNFLISESLTTSAAKRTFSYQVYWKACCCLSAAVLWADVPLAFLNHVNVHGKYFAT